ncbi:hypothetical protein [Methanomassiliicoccus luminyensis]|uniref:hypothetical protein n=1 Tax=Methanomassiliicoccus luminyensis TaxID=1080712 RepID=UPI0011CAEECA|nr:hypothetical protein [Methanomassiliicoccus luminyensis]
MRDRTTHEKRAEAGRMGGLAPHECRGSECTHPSHMREMTTHEKLSEAGKKGARAQPIEAKRKGGQHSHMND